jgi:hypothetical protein
MGKIGFAKGFIVSKNLKITKIFLFYVRVPSMK